MLTERGLGEEFMSTLLKTSVSAAAFVVAGAVSTAAFAQAGPPPADVRAIVAFQ